MSSEHAAVTAAITSPLGRQLGSGSCRVYSSDLRVRVLATGLATYPDVTVICEAPKVGPHAQAMRENLAADLECGIDRISVKATTTERLGFAGRREGIAAQASVLLERA